MNQPIIYLRHQDLTSNHTKLIFEKYFNLLAQNGNNGNKVLDIGCGPGNVIPDIVYPLFKTPIGEVLGIDVATEMINYAKANYEDEVFSFEVFDIENPLPSKYDSYFDYVFSSWCLQWIQDQRKLYSNIAKAMKSKGQMLVFYIAQSGMYDIYQTVWHKPEYSPYISNFNAGQSCFHRSADPKKELLVILEDTGFDVRLIEMETVQLGPSSADYFKNFFAAVSPVLNEIPDRLKKEFILNHVEEVQRDPNIEPQSNYYLKFDLFVVCAAKK